MCAKAHQFDSCNVLIERLEAKINRLALVVLVRRNCTDPENHAPEVVNDVYLKVRQSWGKLHSPEHALYSITKNTASTHAARCRREPPEELDDNAIPLFAAHPLDPRASLELIILLKELVTMLDDELDKEIFNLRFQGYTYEEMAVILERDSDTLRSRFSRAVQKLRPIISPSASPNVRQPVIAHND